MFVVNPLPQGWQMSQTEQFFRNIPNMFSSMGLGDIVGMGLNAWSNMQATEAVSLDDQRFELIKEQAELRAKTAKAAASTREVDLRMQFNSMLATQSAFFASSGFAGDSPSLDALNRAQRRERDRDVRRLRMAGTAEQAEAHFQAAAAAADRRGRAMEGMAQQIQGLNRMVDFAHERWGIWGLGGQR